MYWYADSFWPQLISMFYLLSVIFGEALQQNEVALSRDILIAFCLEILNRILVDF